jgi:HD superfamily phosphohydrolase
MIYIDVCVRWSLCLSGLKYMVYPWPVHTRFEHSLGAYQLAGDAMQNLQMNQVCINKYKFADIYRTAK